MKTFRITVPPRQDFKVVLAEIEEDGGQIIDFDEPTREVRVSLSEHIIRNLKLTGYVVLPD